ncbi:MAG TPA: hypothetical protein VHQ01_08905 [Pyrinomonadaceae bacterium]|nr:hypothetical protein [Pyrinomonadaceae bacterium]
MKNQPTAAERFRQQALKQPDEIETVTVTAPSGFEYVFRKIDLHSHLFGIGHVPQSPAVEKAWENQGLMNAPTKREATQDEKLEMAAYMLRVRDRVMDLSVSPKLVFGVADEANDELSVDEIERRAPQDFAFLYDFVESGGTKATSFANFPDGPARGPVAGANRSQRRAAAKSDRGNKGRG